MEYPAFLPCPEWQYGEGITQFEGRTLMESGWTRQRRAWPQDYTAIELTFKMSTSTFSIWMDFVNANAYSWFKIPLDRFEGEKQVKLIRFISPVQYAYDDFNSVMVTVSGELASAQDSLTGELPNPPKIPPSSVG